MTRLNRKLEYALMALKLMGQKPPGELTSAAEIVEVTGAPFDATARVLQVMAHQGLLHSEHGAHGGYRITKDLSELSLLALIELTLGPLTLVKCMHPDDSCDLQDRCNIQSPLLAFNHKLTEFYRGLAISEILGFTETPTKPFVANSVGVRK